MKDRKGFTLIELLAVLVVLSVILSISVPKIMDVRYESSKKAFTNDVDELQGIAQLEYNNKKEARLYNFEDGNQTNVVNEEDKLKFKGDNPGDGYIKIYSNGDIEYELTSRNHIFCASKEAGDRKGKIEKCKDPTIEKFTLNLSAVTTTNSIRVTVVPKDGEKDAIINEYYYQLDDGKVISSNKASHLYENLKAEENGKLKEYVIKVKACTKNGKCEENTITVKLKPISEIGYKFSPKDWSLEKTITFTYPEIKNVYGQIIGRNEVSTDGGKTFKIYRRSITVNKDTTVVARITDGTNSLKSTAITLSQFDHTAPTITNVTGNPDKWTNQNVTLTVNGAKDKGDNNVEPGSGLADAAYSFDGGVTWQASASYTFKENKSGIVIKVRDKLGNIYTHSSIAITKIDKTAPTCGNWIGQNTTWTKNNITVYAQCASDSGSGCKTSQSKGVLITGTTRTKSVSDVIEDNAGNKTTCTGTVNAFIDQTPPKCISSGGSDAWTNNSRTLVGKCTDGESGCKGNVSWFINWQGNWTNLSPGTVYDNVGNATVCPADQTVRIDKTAPTCTSSGGSDAWTSGSRTLVGTCSDTGGSNCKGNVSWFINWQGNWTKLSPGTVYDNAGNFTACPANQTVRIGQYADIDYTVYLSDSSTESGMNGSLGGTVGKSVAMHNLKLNISAPGISGGISYQGHRQTYGDSGNITAGNTMPTNSNGIKRMEKVRIWLTGDIASAFDVYYRVHVRGQGWLNVVANGAWTGSSSLCKRIEAIQIKAVPKGASKPSFSNDGSNVTTNATVITDSKYSNCETAPAPSTPSCTNQTCSYRTSCSTTKAGTAISYCRNTLGGRCTVGTTSGGNCSCRYSYSCTKTYTCCK